MSNNMEGKVEAPESGRVLKSPPARSRALEVKRVQSEDIIRHWASVKKLQEKSQNIKEEIQELGHQALSALLEAYKNIQVKSHVLYPIQTCHLKKIIVFESKVVADIDTSINQDLRNRSLVFEKGYPMTCNLSGNPGADVSVWPIVPVVNQSRQETKTLIKLCLPDYRILLSLS